MTAPSTIVATLARMLDVLRTDSSDRDLLKSAFRNLYAAVEPSGATISNACRAARCSRARARRATT